MLPLNPGAWQPIGGARSAGKGLNLWPQSLCQWPWSMGKLCRRSRTPKVAWEAGQAASLPQFGGCRKGEWSWDAAAKGVRGRAALGGRGFGQGRASLAISHHPHDPLLKL